MDADSVSAMLSAINDFVSDSFSSATNNEMHLDEIKTDNFSLLIQIGPSAMLAAAVKGRASKTLKHDMQLQLESVHKFFANEFRHFNGEITPFLGSEPYLRECLQNELKNEDSTKAKTLVCDYTRITFDNFRCLLRLPAAFNI